MHREIDRSKIGRQRLARLRIRTDDFAHDVPPNAAPRSSRIETKCN
jgi:hypothetical protein